MGDVTVQSPRAFGIIINHDSAAYGKDFDGPRIGQRRYDIPAGISTQPEEITEHPYFAAHGATVLNRTPDKVVSAATLTAAAEKATKDAARARSVASAAADKKAANAAELDTAATTLEAAATAATAQAAEAVAAEGAKA